MSMSMSTSMPMQKLPKKAMALVVGAGPTGIAALRSLKEVGTVVCVDTRDSIGGALCHAYKGFSLTVTDKNMCYSDSNYNIGNNANGRYPEASWYAEYLENYVEEKNIKDMIYLNTKVTGTKHEGEKWTCETTAGTIVVDHLVVCPGFGSVPKFPHWADPSSIDTNIPIKHTSTLKSTKLGVKSTLVVGYGESSADFVYEAAKSPDSEVVLYVRRGFTTGMRLQTGEEETDANIRKVRNGNQMLEFVANHPLRNMLPKSLFGIFTWLRFVIGGKNPGAGLNAAHCGLACDQEDIVTKNGRFHTSPNVRVVASPANPVIQKDHVELPDGTTMKPDVIILGTGFQRRISWLNACLCVASLEHGFTHPSYNRSLHIMGYLRPHQGGVPILAELQSRVLAHEIKNGFVKCDEMAMMKHKKARSDYYKLLPGNVTLTDLPSYSLYLQKLMGEETSLFYWLTHPITALSAFVHPMWPDWFKRQEEGYPSVGFQLSDFTHPSTFFNPIGFGILFGLMLPFQSISYLLGFPGDSLRPKNSIQWGVISKAHRQLMTLCNIGMIGAGNYFTGAHVPVGKYIEGLMA